MQFDRLKLGTTARVVKFSSEEPGMLRLKELGLTEGALFKVVKIAPFGDPIEIDLRGYRLCLRKKETASIEVEPVE